MYFTITRAISQITKCKKYSLTHITGLHRDDKNYGRMLFRMLHFSERKTQQFNKPLSAMTQMPRPGGIASFMRLPIQDTSQGLNVCFVGVPLDIGTSNRSGTRFGPRQIRTESVIVRPVNGSTGAMPLETLQVADVGDIPIAMYEIQQAVKDIRSGIQKILSNGCIPLTMGGDHTITYPILQAIKEKHGPVGLIHIDAHADVSDEVLGCKIQHGTPFKRAVDEGLLDCKRVAQIGLRGTLYVDQDFRYQWSRDQGFKVVHADECWHKSLTPLMKEIRAQMGDAPVYVSIDIDALDPAYAPGTGTPEIGGLTSIQMLELVRGCRGLNIVGGDLVEVSPPYDTSGNTALAGANILFELLCVLPGVKYLQF
ncbi:agmatinase, mitochondrial-like [Limulus polyphemus]|uniref:Agmatinase, mitochondrial-like n=1 Tax=Limulus polyphemus TaxID=6850 RepID=A0ABM1BBT5_LIMPO|nr:agmatinase, mitochondrial-like [Limulus polyphemus]